ncbi:hypothetical protein [Spirosoma rigui]|uniref:hypothetical protein n=1 Tax=Spirosoma rigui TaxID=564064 RepID=UPI0009B0A9AE|nr:hypothetical protein [Spirosoma rigui]
MKTTHEFTQNDWVVMIEEQAAQALVEANPDIDWPVPVISQYGERVHCWNSERREFTITLSATEIRKVKQSGQ